MLLPFYRTLTRHAGLPLTLLLKKRLAKGKEHAERWQEKKAVTTKTRPEGTLIWLHAASVGEAQSALIIIEKITSHYPDAHVLVTSGTVNSANMLEKRLPENAFHQFVPLDQPAWVKSFFDHWKPDLALWLESEIWPNILLTLKERDIPAILINARLSPKSLKNWQRFARSAEHILSSFSLILCQTEEDRISYKSLGAQNVKVSGNIKYSAAPLPYDETAYKKIKSAIQNRPCWVYASTHAPEELLAIELHKRLKKDVPELLTIIAPRHPERGDDIYRDIASPNVNILQRSHAQDLPDKGTDIYLTDTLGELGLFYRLSSISVIGRSFSGDGGGGHNPIEAAQLGCAVLHGPHVQNLQKIYDDMASNAACIGLEDKEDFYKVLLELLTEEQKLKAAQERATAFCAAQDDILYNVWAELENYLKPLAKEAA